MTRVVRKFVQHDDRAVRTPHQQVGVRAVGVIDDVKVVNEALAQTAEKLRRAFAAS